MPFDHYRLEGGGLRFSFLGHLGLVCKAFAIRLGYGLFSLGIQSIRLLYDKLGNLLQE